METRKFIWNLILFLCFLLMGLFGKEPNYESLMSCIFFSFKLILCFAGILIQGRKINESLKETPPRRSSIKLMEDHDRH